MRLFLLGLPVLLIHLALVWSVARQPLATAPQAAEHRSAIWPLHNDTVHRIGPAADFFAIYHAGQTASTGLDPYGGAERPQITPYFFPFRYLPVVGQTLGRALGLLPPHYAWWCWLSVIELTLLAFAGVLVRRFAHWGLGAFAFGVLFVNSPFFLELHMGQATFVTVAVVLIAALILDRGAPPRFLGHRQVGAAVLYSGAVLLKVFPLASAPAWLKHRRCWPAIAASVGLTLAVSVPYFLQHPEQWQTFWAANFSQPVGGMDTGNYGVIYLIHLTLRALSPTWVDLHWPTFAATWRISVLGFAALAVVLTRAKDPLAGTVLLFLAHFASYVHVWEHHTSGVLLLGLALLWHIARREHQRRRADVVAL
jgi:hypothetical protein